jgi:hypothetical protein
MKKSIHLLTALVGFLMIYAPAAAQKRNVKGFIKDSATREPLSNVLVTDAFARQLGHTDAKGYFNIPLKEGQTMFFDAPAYHYDTLRLATMTPDTVTVYLAHLPNDLIAITVTARGYNKYQQDSIKRRQAFEDDAVQKTPTFAKSNTDAGFALNLDPFISKKQRKRKSAAEMFQEIEETDYVDYRFPRSLVSSYTGLKDDDLSVFVEKYRPTYEWLRDHPTDEAVFFYINDKLKSYMKRKK